MFFPGDIVAAKNVERPMAAEILERMQNGQYRVVFLALRMEHVIPANDSYEKIGHTWSRAEELSGRAARKMGRKIGSKNETDE